MALSELLKLVQVLFFIFATALVAALGWDYMFGGKSWLIFKLGRRQNDYGEDWGVIIAVLKTNEEALKQIAHASQLSHEQVLSLAIQHLVAMPSRKQQELVKQYLHS